MRADHTSVESSFSFQLSVQLCPPFSVRLCDWQTLRVVEQPHQWDVHVVLSQLVDSENEKIDSLREVSNDRLFE